MATTDAERSDEQGTHPSGWLAISRHESIAYMLDSILDLPPHRGFTQTELAEMADVSRQSVSRHLGFLIDIEVIEPIQDTSPQRFRFKPECEVSQALVRLDGAMNKAGEKVYSTDD